MNQERLVIIERREYEALLVRLGYLESELKLFKHEPEKQDGEQPKKKRGFWDWFWGREAKVLAVVMMVLVLGAGALGQPKGSGFFNGNDYLQLKPIEKSAYIAGVSDAFTLSAEFPEVNYGSFKICTDKMTIGQIKAIVEKYMKENPEYWHHVMASTIFGAVMKACEK